MKWLTAVVLRRAVALLLLALATTADLLGVLPRPVLEPLAEAVLRLFESNWLPPSLP